MVGIIGRYFEHELELARPVASLGQESLRLFQILWPVLQGTIKELDVGKLGDAVSLP